jgi:mRNA-degrading endonuclease toxin of MazEF toxin-antitoxin module
VYWADLSPRTGAEQRGHRPVIVVSHDGFNTTPGWRSVIVVPISPSGTQARRGPTAVPLAAGAGGLGRACVALCHQVTTLDRGKLARRIGTLSVETLSRIASGLRVALDLV